MQAGDITGWYGKLPSLGDFASRRLSPEFIEVWDGWLAAGLADWRQRAAATWLDDYLAGPSWRFVLMPGVLAGDVGAWAGVLMPSVDKVGRYFPLTLAQPLSALPATAAQGGALLDWLQRLDDLAVASLQDDWSVEQLEAGLHDLGPWQHEPPPPQDGLSSRLTATHASSETIELQPPAGVVALLAQAARTQLLQGLQGRALWLRSDAQARPVLRVTVGLPRGIDFSALLTCDDTKITATHPAT